MLSSEVAVLSSKHNAIISACNEIDQHRPLGLICSHCWHSGDGLPVRIHCVECFISKQWFNALWSTTSCASHTSSGVLLGNTWGEVRWGLVSKDEVSLHCRNNADWAILIDRPRLYSELSEVRESCATIAVFAKRGESHDKINADWLLGKSLFRFSLPKSSARSQKNCRYAFWKCIVVK